MKAAKKAQNPAKSNLRGMGSRISGPNPKVADFKIRRSDTSRFATVQGLSNMAGVGADELRRLIVKEVVDNALDEMDSARYESPSFDGGSVTVRRDGDDTYIVADEGRGIEQNPKELCDLFSADRSMVTSKALRRPSRGVLGNGLRILAGAVAQSGGTIIVESHGLCTTLRPRKVGARIGETELVSQVRGPRKLGTQITYTLDRIIPYDDEDDLFEAEDAISLAEVAGPPYMRLPSPHWQDRDHLVEIFDIIEPEIMTVRQLVEGLDGCSGAKAGKIAEPFGKGRTCRSMQESEIAELLRRMQKSARIVKPHSLGLIGKDAFGEAYDGYKFTETEFYPPVAHEPYARIPVLIEAWASVTSRRGGESRLLVYCNRTPVVENVDATRERNGISIYGAGLDGAMEVEGGECDLILAVTSPYIPTKSIGKAPDLSRLEPEIIKALSRAFNMSRNRVPTEPAQPKPPKAEPPPKKPKPEPYQPSGPLAILLAEEAEQAGLSPRDLLVLSARHDPFDESKAIRRDAEWFVEQVNRFVPGDKKVHLRGMYYRCQSAGDVRLPDGRLFTSDLEKSAEYIEKAGKYARHLGLIAFDRIIDERAAPPERFVSEEQQDDATDDPIHRELIVSDGSKPLDVSELESLIPTLSVAAPKIPRQPFRICLIGEKASLGDVLRPIAQEVHGEMYLTTGEISEAAAYEIASRAAKDGRSLRILYFSDFDPSGWQMPISIARKLQAHICREFHDLDVQVIRVGLTIEQVNEFDLPESPFKETEKRAGTWKKYWGREQVEIDSLAALRPEVLDRIAREAVAPYFDPTFEQRYPEAMEVPEEQLASFLNHPAYRKAKASIQKAYEPTVRAIAKLNAATTAAVDVLRHVVEKEMADLSDVVVTPEIEGDLEDNKYTIFDSNDNFVTATQRLQDLKALALAAEDDD